MLVADIMSTDLKTLAPNATLYDARSCMYENKIRHIPIVDSGQLLGLISQRDVLGAEHSSLLNMTANSRIEGEREIRIEEFMHTELVTIEPQASLLKAALYIQKHKLGCLPVLKDDELVGIITDSDFVNVAINLMEVAEEQSDTCEDY